MNPQTTKVKNGRILLPKRLQEAWREAKVFIFPDQDTLIIKRVQKPLSRLSELASRITSKKLSQEEIEKEIQAFRKNK